MEYKVYTTDTKKVRNRYSTQKVEKEYIREYTTYHYPDGDTFLDQKILTIVPKPMYATNHRR